MAERMVASVAEVEEVCLRDIRMTSANKVSAEETKGISAVSKQTNKQNITVMSTNTSVGRIQGGTYHFHRWPSLIILEYISLR